MYRPRSSPSLSTSRAKSLVAQTRPDQTRLRIVAANNNNEYKNNNKPTLAEWAQFKLSVQEKGRAQASVEPRMARQRCLSCHLLLQPRKRTNNTMTRRVGKSHRETGGASSVAGAFKDGCEGSSFDKAGERLLRVCRMPEGRNF